MGEVTLAIVGTIAAVLAVFFLFKRCARNNPVRIDQQKCLNLRHCLVVTGLYPQISHRLDDEELAFKMSGPSHTFLLHMA